MVFRNAEVNIRNVASPDDPHSVVHDEQLVVHPPVNAGKIDQKLIVRQNRLVTGLKKRISMLGWPSSAATAESFASV